MISLNTPVSQLYMVGESYSQRLKKLGIINIRDLLYHLPFRYDNYSLVSTINKLQPGEKVSVWGTITSFENIYTKYGKKLQKGKLADETGEIEVIWYNQPFLRNILKRGLKIVLSGEVKWFGHKLVFESPEYEIIKNPPSRSPYEHLEGVTKLLLPGGLIHTGRLVPIYPETAGVSSKWLRSKINWVLTKLSLNIPEILPSPILSEFNLMGRNQAIRKIHFPSDFSEAESARRRISFDELLTLQLVANQRKKQAVKKRVGHKLKTEPYKKELYMLISSLPFNLTSAQKRVFSEILADLSKERPMNRLLEGDVGSGKTVVAALAMYLTYLNGYTSVLLAPTEILAHQHFETISTLLKPCNIKISLLTGKTKLIYSSSDPDVTSGESRSKKFSTSVNNTDSIDIFIGTHALLSEKLHIKKLALVVIDEQQRFGVQQRAIIREKGENPHVLILTATPIPRTIALTLYSDLDLSILDDMPTGRKKIKTWVVPAEKRQAAYKWIEEKIKKSQEKQQAFIICPFIEEPARIATQNVAGGSESLQTVKAASKEFERLKNKIFPSFNLGLLHGKLNSIKKQKVMRELDRGNLDILVATPVVEVGIDIPRATIMMIEGADRFGLAQLHQLRGRVGRGNLESYCLLFTDAVNPKTTERLKIMEKVFSGPKLAEYDLKLRGMGEIYGTAQHGRFGLKVADITDMILIEETKEAASMLLKSDPELTHLPPLKEEVQKYTIEKVAPD